MNSYQTPGHPGGETAPLVKRPPSVVWAGIIFWTIPAGILIMHTKLGATGPDMVKAILMSALLLIAAFLWLAYPVHRLTFRAGVMALVAFTHWCAFAAVSQYRLRTEIPDMMTPVAGTGVMAVMLAVLTYRYVFGGPARRYFERM